MVAQFLTPSQFDRILAEQAELMKVAASTFSYPWANFFLVADQPRFVNTFEVRLCKPREVIIREGEKGDTIYLIRLGKVAILKGDLDSPIVLAVKGAGEIIGEMALLENRPRSATVVALEEVSLLGLNRQGFQKLIQESPGISLGIMEMLSSRLREADELRSSGELSEQQLTRQLSVLQNEKQQLEELVRLRQETSELIIHDLRNPLSAIGIALQMLNLTLPEEILKANQHILEVVRLSYERMQRLVDTLLEVSRLELGEAHFVWGEVDLEAMIEAVLDRVSPLERRGIDLQTQLPSDLPRVVADHDRMERVLTNLIDNALKYTPENGQIVVSAEIRDDYLWVSVTDTGPGVPQEERERIFERFAQGEAERPKRCGFGLGLAYCRLAVQGHGGRIWVEDGEGGLGSRFVFTLPLAKQTKGIP